MRFFWPRSSLLPFCFILFFSCLILICMDSNLYHIRFYSWDHRTRQRCNFRDHLVQPFHLKRRKWVFYEVKFTIWRIFHCYTLLSLTYFILPAFLGCFLKPLSSPLLDSESLEIFCWVFLFCFEVVCLLLTTSLMWKYV